MTRLQGLHNLVTTLSFLYGWDYCSALFYAKNLMLMVSSLCVIFACSIYRLGSLRVNIYGFRGLVKDFLSSHPGHHIILGESMAAGSKHFGQLKHRTSENLTGHNYGSTKAVLLTRRQVTGAKQKDDYRNTPLNIRQSELRWKSVTLNGECCETSMIMLCE